MQPNPNPNPNTQPQPSNPNTAPNVPEKTVQPSPERPAAPEVAPQAPQGVPVPPPAATPPPATPPVPVDTDTAQGAAQANPASAAPNVGPNPAEAADTDRIEKEWVDQANKIVEQTKNDPYVEEEAVESLQQDYLKKRYNHDVKKPEDQ
jgi:hypothetical protein